MASAGNRIFRKYSLWARSATTARNAASPASEAPCSRRRRWDSTSRDDPGFPGKRGRNINWWTFAPRLGFAWDVNGDGRTSVRASTGIAYDYPNSQFHLWTSISQPWGAAVTINNPSFDDPWASQPGGNPFPAQYGVNSAVCWVWRVDRHSLRSEAGPDPELEPGGPAPGGRGLARSGASYLGSHTIHMLGAEPINPADLRSWCGRCQRKLLPQWTGGELQSRCWGRLLEYRGWPGRYATRGGGSSLIDFQETGQFAGIGVAGQQRREFQLSRSASEPPQAGCPGRHGECELHLVALHRSLPGQRERRDGTESHRPRIYSQATAIADGATAARTAVT